METKIKNLMLTLFSVVFCISTVSCSSDDNDPNKGIGNYYFQLYSVDTNCIDANGVSLKEALISEWVKANNADSQRRISLGKIDNETAKLWFYNQISALVQTYNATYAGKNLLPKGGWIIYTYSLNSNAPYGGAEKNAVIKVDNDGANIE